MKNVKSQKTSPQNRASLGRRTVLKTAAATAAATTATSPSAASTRYRPGTGHPVFGGGALRRNASINVRVKAAEQQFIQTSHKPQKSNGDEGKYDDYRASFSKTLVHNQLGEVDPRSYKSLLRALRENRQRAYENIILDNTVRTRKLANPQAAYKFEQVGVDAHATRMPSAPKFASLVTAAEMGEVYAKAEARDVPFAKFETSRKIQRIIQDLNKFSRTVGPTSNGQVTISTVFRGDTPGDVKGPFISQFLLRSIPFGNNVITQKYDMPTRGRNFLTNYDHWLAAQRGAVPEVLESDNPRYIYNPRALCEYVHKDVLYQSYLHAALIILSLGPDALSVENPYLDFSQQGNFVSFGPPDVIDLLSKAANLSLTGAWYQKWLAHRRLRPEAYGGRLHNQITGKKNYGLPSEIADSRLIHKTFKENGSYLLSQAYPEGSPTHPSYPAGHATVAGACSTILKAFFNEDFVMPNNVDANADGTRLNPIFNRLTVGDEINKLANNIALGRDWAGVHYRSDGNYGLEVGEQQAIGLLQDYCRTYNERFDGFSLTKFNGEEVQILEGQTKKTHPRRRPTLRRAPTIRISKYGGRDR